MFYFRLLLEWYFPHGTNNLAAFTSPFRLLAPHELCLCWHGVSPWIKISALQKERITFTICACDMMLFFFLRGVRYCSVLQLQFRERDIFLDSPELGGKKKAFQERHFVIEWSFKTPLYACILVESQGTDRFSLTSQLSASRRTYNPCSTVCFLHTSRAVIGTTIRGLLLKPHRFHHRGEKKVIRSLWAWSIVRVEPAQIISFMFEFKEMRNILQEKTSYFTSAPSPTVILPASLPPSFSWRACPLCYPTPTPTLLVVFFFFFQFVKMLKSALCDLWRNLKRLVSQCMKIPQVQRGMANLLHCLPGLDGSVSSSEP